ncbi:MAG: SIMPL domain-containing protein [Thermomicrobiales bacterium]|nr:SIMPL domain-containing protein [Thermomicrobiales bacterium]
MKRILSSSGIIGVAMLAIVALAAPIATFAQQATPEPGAASDTGRSITVSGRGTITIEPDSVSIVVGVDVFGETLVETNREAGERMTAVLETVTAAGIPEDKVQTTNYSIFVVNDWDDQGRLQGVSGYQVSNQVQITTDDIDGLGELIDSLVASGANTIYSINFFASDASAALSQARAMAVADATNKATELAEAANVELGEIVAIVESSFGGGPVAREQAMMDSAAGYGGTPIQSGSLQISIDVQITWSISG